MCISSFPNGRIAAKDPSDAAAYFISVDPKKTGELVRQAERKSSNFDPLPDADNAAVGSRFFGFFTGGTLGPPVFCTSRERGNVVRAWRGGLRGSALSLVSQRWEAVFRRERMPASIDRPSVQSQRSAASIFGSVAVYSRFRFISKECQD